MKLERGLIFLLSGCFLLFVLICGGLVSAACNDCGPYSASSNTDAKTDEVVSTSEWINTINQYNEENNLGWVAGETSMTSLSSAEQEKRKGLKPSSISSKTASVATIQTRNDLPDSFDWRDYRGGDWTTPVKNQGECGSCWAFATTAIFESYYKRVNNNPDLSPDFSEQYLLSCNEVGADCNGSVFGTIMPYFVDRADSLSLVGTVAESDYPYEATKSDCKVDVKFTRFTAESWNYVNESAFVPTVTELKTAIYEKGPLAVGMYTDDTFSAYKSGIFEDPVVRNTTNHGVVLVGWGISGDKEYFIAKNSWGTGWGDSGWFKIATTSSLIGEEAVYFDYSTSNVLTADFSADVTSAAVPLTVNFYDKSLGVHNKWLWSFGDGLTSTDSNPVHTYVSPGKYSVSLMVSQGDYSDYIVKEDYIHAKVPYQKIYPFPKINGGYYPMPTDPDDDGLFEDIDGNGWLDFNDPEVLFQNMAWAIDNEPVTLFDFDGSGFIGFEDVAYLKAMV